MLAPDLGSIQQLDYGPVYTYRDSIRRVSASGGLCRSALRFFPTTFDTEAGEGAYWWSSGSAASSPAHGSSVSSSFSSDSDLCFSDWGEELRAIALQMVQHGYMQGIIRAFGAGCSSSAPYGGPSPGASLKELLGSWFAELDVEWVLPAGEGDRVQLHLEEGFASLLDLVERWIKALKTMVHVLCITQAQLELRAKRPAVSGVRKAIGYLMLLATGKLAEAEHEQEVAQFVRFAEASILMMLDFVDPVANAALKDDYAPKSLPGMLQVYICVVDDSPTILALFEEASTHMSMFEAKTNKLSGTTWSIMEKVRASFETDDFWRISPAEAGGIHKTARLTMNYVTLLSRNEGALNFVLQDQTIPRRNVLVWTRLLKPGCQPHQGSDLLHGEAAREDILFYYRPWIAVHILDEQLQLHFRGGFILAPAVLDCIQRLQD